MCSRESSLKVVFEVLSPETERLDRTQKLDYCQLLESLTDYVLISQDTVRVEQFSRAPNGWLYQSFNRRADVVSLSSVETELSLEELYFDLDVPEQLALWSGQTGESEMENDS